MTHLKSSDGYISGRALFRIGFWIRVSNIHFYQVYSRILWIIYFLNQRDLTQIHIKIFWSRLFRYFRNRISYVWVVKTQNFLSFFFFNFFLISYWYSVKFWNILNDFYPFLIIFVPFNLKNYTYCLPKGFGHHRKHRNAQIPQKDWKIGDTKDLSFFSFFHNLFLFSCVVFLLNKQIRWEW
jgi:hypothetical protein